MPEPTPIDTFVERRKDASQAVLELIASLKTQVDQVNTNLLSYRQEQKDDLEAAMIRAFPDGDPEGHRRHHEAVIRAAEARAEFWTKMRFELFKWGMFGFMGWAAVQLWRSFVVGPPQ